MARSDFKRLSRFFRLAMSRFSVGARRPGLRPPLAMFEQSADSPAR
jgi:hypothetical protein